MAETEITIIPKGLHANEHETGGIDEVSVAGLAGETINLAAHILLPTIHQDAPALIAAENHPTIVHKTPTQVVNNSIVLVNDNDLLFAVAANEIWEFFIVIRTLTPTVNPDFDFLFAIPVGGGIIKHIGINGGANNPQEIDGTVEQTLALTAAAIHYHPLHYLYVGGGNAGNIQLQWAQNVAIAEDTAVLEDSYIIAHRIL